jgi:hypothetical protein
LRMFTVRGALITIREGDSSSRSSETAFIMETRFLLVAQKVESHKFRNLEGGRGKLLDSPKTPQAGSSVETGYFEEV